MDTVVYLVAAAILAVLILTALKLRMKTREGEINDRAKLLAARRAAPF